MRNKFLFVLAGVGVLLGLMGAWYFGVRQPPQPPVFNPAQNPYKQGIYANGIIESAQGSGENVNIFPEVAGPVTKILVAEGQTVRAGTPLLIIDYAVQQATTVALKAQADAAGTLLEELKSSRGRRRSKSPRRKRNRPTRACGRRAISWRSKASRTAWIRVR